MNQPDREEAKRKAIEESDAGWVSDSWREGFDAGWAARETEYAAQDEREINRLIEDEML